MADETQDPTKVSSGYVQDPTTSIDSGYVDDFSPAKPLNLKGKALSRAAELGLPEDLVSNIGQQESGWEHYAGGGRVKMGPLLNDGRRAIGAMQVVEDTPGSRKRTIGGTTYDLTDPDQNVEAGLNYLHEGYTKHGNDPKLAALYYFGGPGAVARARGGQIPNISDKTATTAGTSAKNYVANATKGLSSAKPNGTGNIDSGYVDDLSAAPSGNGQGNTSGIESGYVDDFPAQPNLPLTAAPQQQRELPQQGVMPGAVHLNPAIAPKVPDGAPRPFAPGEWVDNPDGSWSSEISSTIQNSDGSWSVVPGMWLVNGKPQRVNEDQAAQYAQQSGLNFPKYRTLDEAEKFATDRESVWQGVRPQDASKIPPLWQPSVPLTQNTRHDILSGLPNPNETVFKPETQPAPMGSSFYGLEQPGVTEGVHNADVLNQQDEVIDRAFGKGAGYQSRAADPQERAKLLDNANKLNTATDFTAQAQGVSSGYDASSGRWYVDDPKTKTRQFFNTPDELSQGIQNQGEQNWLVQQAQERTAQREAARRRAQARQSMARAQQVAPTVQPVGDGRWQFDDPKTGERVFANDRSGINQELNRRGYAVQVPSPKLGTPEALAEAAGGGANPAALLQSPTEQAQARVQEITNQEQFRQGPGLAPLNQRVQQQLGITQPVQQPLPKLTDEQIDSLHAIIPLSAGDRENLKAGKPVNPSALDFARIPKVQQQAATIDSFRQQVKSERDVAAAKTGVITQEQIDQPGYFLPDVMEQDAQKRFQAYEQASSERERLLNQVTPGDKADYARILGNITTDPGWFRAIDIGQVQVAGRLLNLIAAGLAAGGPQTAPGADAIRRKVLMANEAINTAVSRAPMSKKEEAAAFVSSILGDLSRLGLLTTFLGPIVGMGVDSAAQAKAANLPNAQVAAHGIGGAATGAIFEVAPAFETAGPNATLRQKLFDFAKSSTAVGAGTYGALKLSGASDEEATRGAVTNTLLHGIAKVAPEIGGRTQQFGSEVAARTKITPEWLRSRIAESGGLGHVVLREVELPESGEAIGNEALTKYEGKPTGRALSAYKDPTVAEDRAIGGTVIDAAKTDGYAKRGVQVIDVTPEQFETALKRVNSINPAEPAQLGKMPPVAPQIPETAGPSAVPRAPLDLSAIDQAQQARVGEENQPPPEALDAKQQALDALTRAHQARDLDASQHWTVLARQRGATEADIENILNLPNEPPAKPPAPETPRVPETETALAAQVMAMMEDRGNRKAVIVTDYHDLPDMSGIPNIGVVRGPQGEQVIYRKDKVSGDQVQEMMRSGRSNLLTGMPNPETPEATVAAVVRGKDNKERWAGYITPGNIEAFRKESEAQFGQQYGPLKFDFGGAETENSILKDRVAELRGEQVHAPEEDLSDAFDRAVPPEKSVSGAQQPLTEAAGPPKAVGALEAGQSAQPTVQPERKSLPRNVEMMRVSDLARFADKQATPNSPEENVALKADIKANGITEPLILSYDPNTKRSYLYEGNNRLAIAQELGVRDVPVRVLRNDATPSKGTPVRGFTESGHVPAELAPSRIGLVAATERVPEGKPKSESAKSPQEVIEAAGYKYLGEQQRPKGKPPLQMFNDETGSTLTLEPDQVTPEGIKAKVAASREARGRSPLKTKDKPKSEFVNFPSEMQSLGIPRNAMPQIDPEHRGSMTQFLKGRGIEWSHEEVLPTTLKPSQAEYNPAKVENARKWEEEHPDRTPRRILVSNDCVDETTKILTLRGWLGYQEVRQGDVALTLNHDTGKSEWSHIKALTVLPPQRRRMLLMEGDSHSSLTTLTHRWPVLYLRANCGKRSTATRRWRTSEDLTTWDALILAAECATLPRKQTYSDAVVELVAWTTTEGTIRPNGKNVHIAQSQTVNAPYCALIRGSLHALFGKPVRSLKEAMTVVGHGPRRGFSYRDRAAWTESPTRANGVVTFRLTASAAALLLAHLDRDKVVSPNFLTKLTQRQLELFIDRCVDADGHWGAQTVFVQKSEESTAMFQMACALAGRKTSAVSHGDDCLRTTIAPPGFDIVHPVRRTQRSDEFTMEIVEHDGTVWCPTTDNGSWLARRKGMVYFTGNSYVLDAHHQWVHYLEDRPNEPIAITRIHQPANVAIPELARFPSSYEAGTHHEAEPKTTAEGVRPQPSSVEGGVSELGHAAPKLTRVGPRHEHPLDQIQKVLDEAGQIKGNTFNVDKTKTPAELRKLSDQARALWEQYYSVENNYGKDLPERDPSRIVMALNALPRRIDAYEDELAAAPTTPEQIATMPWVRGERPDNTGRPRVFFSTAEDIADNFGEVRKAKADEIPTNPLITWGKEDLAPVIGYKGDPLAEPLDTPRTKRFDVMAEKYARERGHDGIYYENGMFGAPEMVRLSPVEQAQTPAEPKKEKQVVSGAEEVVPAEPLSPAEKRKEQRFQKFLRDQQTAEAQSAATEAARKAASERIAAIPPEERAEAEQWAKDRWDSLQKAKKRDRAEQRDAEWQQEKTRAELPGNFILIACSADKTAEAAPAKDLYQGDLFKKSRAYAEQQVDNEDANGYFILSAKHGLVDPTEKLDPYDSTLKQFNKPQTQAWGEKVLAQIKENIPAGSTITLLAGTDYARPIEDQLTAAGYKVERPLKGLGIGEQKAKLIDLTKEASHVEPTEGNAPVEKEGISERPKSKGGKGRGGQAARGEAQSEGAAEGGVVEPYKFSSTQVQVTGKAAKLIRAAQEKISSEDLNPEAHPPDGLEHDAHVTLKYGLHSNSPAEVEDLLADEGPIAAKFGKVDVFEGVEDGTADAVIVRIESPDLHRLNKKIADNVEVTDTHPEYKPHATLAYVKLGTGKKYAGMDVGLEGKELTFDSVRFSAKDRSETDIPLKEKEHAREVSENIQPFSKLPQLGPWSRRGTAGDRFSFEEKPPAVVKPRVLFRRENLEIFDTVVPLYTVDMVNDLVRAQLSPQMLLNDESVLLKLPTVDFDGLVTLGLVEPASKTLTRAGAEVAGSDSTRRAFDFFSAGGAVEIGEPEVVRDGGRVIYTTSVLFPASSTPLGTELTGLAGRRVTPKGRPAELTKAINPRHESIIQEEAQNAIKTRKQPEGGEREHPRTPSRKHVRTDEGEIRSGQGKRAGGSNRAERGEEAQATAEVEGGTQAPTDSGLTHAEIRAVWEPTFDEERWFQTDFAHSGEGAEEENNPEFHDAIADGTITKQRMVLDDIREREAVLASGIKPDTGRKLTAKQREAIEKELASLKDDYQARYENYAEPYGQEAADKARALVEREEPSNVRHAGRTSPERSTERSTEPDTIQTRAQVAAGVEPRTLTLDEEREELSKAKAGDFLSDRQLVQGVGLSEDEANALRDRVHGNLKYHDGQLPGGNYAVTTSPQFFRDLALKELKTKAKGLSDNVLRKHAQAIAEMMISGQPNEKILKIPANREVYESLLKTPAGTTATPTRKPVAAPAKAKTASRTKDWIAAIRALPADASREQLQELYAEGVDLKVKQTATHAQVLSGLERAIEQASPASPVAEKHPEEPERKKETKPSEKTNRAGFTKEQAAFIAKETAEYAHEQLVKAYGKEEAERMMKEAGYEFPVNTVQLQGEKTTIKVPNDGEFTVDNAYAANKLHQRATGQPVEGFERAKGASVSTGTPRVGKDQGRIPDLDDLIAAFGGNEERTMDVLKRSLAFAEEHGEAPGAHEQEKLINELQKRFESRRNPDEVRAPFVRHKEAVSEALKRGLPVPPEVLAEYPDLQQEPARDSTVKPVPYQVVQDPDRESGEVNYKFYIRNEDFPMRVGDFAKATMATDDEGHVIISSGFSKTPEKAKERLLYKLDFARVESRTTSHDAHAKAREEHDRDAAPIVAAVEDYFSDEGHFGYDASQVAHDLPVARKDWQEPLPVQETPTLDGLNRFAAQQDRFWAEQHKVGTELQKAQETLRKEHARSRPQQLSGRQKAQERKNDAQAKVRELESQIEQLNATRRKSWLGHDVEFEDYSDYLYFKKELPAERLARYEPAKPQAPTEGQATERPKPTLTPKNDGVDRNITRTAPVKGSPEYEALDKRVEELSAKSDKLHGEAGHQKDLARRARSQKGREIAEAKSDELYEKSHQVAKEQKEANDLRYKSLLEDAVINGEPGNALAARATLNLEPDKNAVWDRLKMMAEDEAKKLGATDPELIERVALDAAGSISSFPASTPLSKQVEMSYNRIAVSDARNKATDEINDLSDLQPSERSRFVNQVRLDYKPEEIEKTVSQARELNAENERVNQQQQALAEQAEAEERQRIADSLNPVDAINIPLRGATEETVTTGPKYIGNGHMLFLSDALKPKVIEAMRKKMADKTYDDEKTAQVFDRALQATPDDSYKAEILGVLPEKSKGDRYHAFLKSKDGIVGVDGVKFLWINKNVPYDEVRAAKTTNNKVVQVNFYKDGEPVGVLAGLNLKDKELPAEQGFEVVPPEAKEPEATKSNWRQAADEADDPFVKNDILRGIANVESTPEEQADVLERAEKIDPQGPYLSNLYYDISQNKAASPETKARALELSEKQYPPSEPVEAYSDVGQKVGGARKDLAVSTGPVAERKPKSEQPSWAKRFEVHQIAKSTKPEEEGKWVIYDTKNKDWIGQPRPLSGLYDSKEDAEAFLPVAAVAIKHRVWEARKEHKDDPTKYEIYRKIGDRKMVKVVDQQFDSRDDAMKYMGLHAPEILETKTSFGEEILPRPDKVTREGKVRRTQNATPEMFMNAFGLRGVEFGNWNNQLERQEVVNFAFDSLADLAELLNIPPRAIGLNGELALAFGARGHGLTSVRAHYERNYGVINLTKMSGAGALAHEWFHALDHYFGRLSGKAKAERVENKRGDKVFDASIGPSLDYVTHGFPRDNKARQEIKDAYDELVKTMFKKAETYVEDSQKAERFLQETREDVRKKLEAIRDGQHYGLSVSLDPKYYKRNAKPASAEQLAEFDRIAKSILDGEAISTEWRTSPTAKSFSGRWTNDALERLSEIYKAVRGRSGFNAEKTGVLDELRQRMKLYDDRLKMLASAQKGEEKTKHVPTSFAMEAKGIDQGRAEDYFLLNHEMAAPAFQAYVEDKLSEQGGHNDFLSYGSNMAVYTPWGWKRPFPQGDERVAINDAFDKLVGALKTKETEKGVALFAHHPSDSPLVSHPLGYVDGNAVSLGPGMAGRELLRDLYRRRGHSVEGYPHGLYEPGNGVNVANSLDEMAQEGREGAATLAEAVRAASQVDDGHIIFYTSDLIKQHEQTHYHTQIASGGKSLRERHAPEGLSAMLSDPAWPRIRDGLYDRNYEGDDPYLVEEAFAWLSVGENFGLSPEESANFIAKWIDSFTARNGVQSLRTFKELSNATREQLIPRESVHATGDRERANQRLRGVHETRQGGSSETPDDSAGELQEARGPDARQQSLEGFGDDRRLAGEAGNNQGLQLAEPSVGTEGERERSDTSRPITHNPAFRNWFGDSIVTDNGRTVAEGGTPQVVYHGTQADFNAFDPEAEATTYERDKGIFFFTSDQSDAGSYAEDNGRNANTAGANVMPVYLSLQNPLMFTVEGSTNPSVYFDEHGDYLLDQARDDDNDGIIVHNLDDGEETLVAFKPEQIKSATGNSGQFDPSNPNILMARMPEDSAVVKSGTAEFSINKEQELEQAKRDILNQNPGRTIANELLQNAIDADSKDISVTADRKTGTFVLADDGHGMSEEDVVTKLLRLGNVGEKGEAHAGGYGRASVAFLLFPERATVQTTKDGVTTHFSGTADTLQRGKVNYTVRKTNQPDGSLFQLQFAEKDNYEIERAKDQVEKFASEMKRDVRITLNSRAPWDDRMITQHLAAKEERQRYPPIIIEHNGSTFEVEFPEQPPNPYAFAFGGRYSINTRFLNKGLPLGDVRSSVSPGLIDRPDFSIVVNVSRTPKTSDERYPFIKNRTELTKSAEAAIREKLEPFINSLNTGIHERDLAELHEDIDSAPVYGNTRVVLTGLRGEAKQQVADVLAENEDILSAIGKGFQMFQQMLSGVGYKNIELAITSNPKTYGWRPSDQTGVKEIYAINPFAIDGELLDQVYATAKEQGRDPNAMRASNMVHTLVHEFTHNFAENHNEPFTIALSKHYTELGHRDLAKVEDYFDKVLTDKGEEYNAIQQQLENVYRRLAERGEGVRESSAISGSISGPKGKDGTRRRGEEPHDKLSNDALLAPMPEEPETLEGIIAHLRRMAGEMAVEEERPEGQEVRSLPRTLDAADIPTEGAERYYEPESIAGDGLERAKRQIEEKGIDGAMEFVRGGDGIEWAATGFEILNRLRAQEQDLRDEGQQAEAQRVADKRLRFLDDFSLGAVERGRSIVGIKAVAEFSPDRASYLLNKASMRGRRRGITSEEETRIVADANEYAGALDRIKALEHTVSVWQDTAHEFEEELAKRRARKPVTLKYEVNLTKRAESAKGELAERLKAKGKLDFGHLVASITPKVGEKGAVGHIAPLPGDAELLAEYAAAQLAHFDTLAELNEHLVQSFGEQVRPYLAAISQRAYQIRRDAREAEMSDEQTDVQRRRTILQEIQAEIRKYEQAEKEAERAVERLEAAQKRVNKKEFKAEARSQAKAVRDADREERKRLAADARQRVKDARREYAEASKAESKGWRERIRAQREAARTASLWDTPIRQAAAEARTRLENLGFETQTDQFSKEPSVISDLAAIGAEKFLREKQGGTVGTKPIFPSQFYQEMQNEFPGLVTKKNRGEILKRAKQRVDDVTAAGREAARLRSADKAVREQWENAGVDTNLQGVLVQKAEATRQAQEARRRMQDEFQRVSRPAWKRALISIKNAPRSLQTSLNLHQGRQGMFALLTHPIEVTGKVGLPQSLKGMTSWKRADFLQAVEELRSHRHFDLFVKAGGEVAELPEDAGETALTAEEDQLQSPLAMRLPHVRLSTQGFILGMNSERLALFSLWASLGEANGYTWETNPRFFKQAAQIANDASGRSTMPKALKTIARLTNELFYATRLNISRVMLLNDLFNPFRYLPPNLNPLGSGGAGGRGGGGLPPTGTGEAGRGLPEPEEVGRFDSYDPVMRRIMIGNLIRLASALAVLLLTAKLLGFHFYTDPDDPDTWKIVWRNHHTDLSGGSATLIKFAYRFTRSIARTVRGEQMPEQERPLELAWKFIRQKMAPWPTALVDFLTGKNTVGEAANLKVDLAHPTQTMKENIIARMLLPISVEETTRAFSEDGWQGGVPATLMQFLGFETQTYERRDKGSAAQQYLSRQRQIRQGPSDLTPEEEDNSKLRHDLEDRLRALHDSIRQEVAQRYQGMSEKGIDDLTNQRYWAMLRTSPAAKDAMTPDVRAAQADSERDVDNWLTVQQRSQRDAITGEIVSGVSSGKLKPAAEESIARSAALSRLELSMKYADLRDAMDAFENQMTAEERAETKNVLAAKSSSIKSLPAPEQAAVRARLQKLTGQPVSDRNRRQRTPQWMPRSAPSPAP